MTSEQCDYCKRQVGCRYCKHAGQGCLLDVVAFFLAVFTLIWLSFDYKWGKGVPPPLPFFDAEWKVIKENHKSQLEQAPPASEK